MADSAPRAPPPSTPTPQAADMPAPVEPNARAPDAASSASTVPTRKQKRLPYVQRLERDLDLVEPHLVPYVRAVHDGIRDAMLVSPSLKDAVSLAFRLAGISGNGGDRLLSAREKEVEEEAQPTFPPGAPGIPDPAELVNTILQPTANAAQEPPPRKRAAADEEEGDMEEPVAKKPLLEKKDPKVGDWRCSCCKTWIARWYSRCQEKKSDGTPCPGRREKASREIRGDHAPKHDLQDRAIGDWFCENCGIWNPSHWDQCRQGCKGWQDDVKGYEIGRDEGAGMPERHPSPESRPHLLPKKEKPTGVPGRRHFWEPPKSTNGRYFERPDKSPWGSGRGKDV